MSDYFDRVERQIVRNVEAGVPRGSFLPVAGRYLASVAAAAMDRRLLPPEKALPARSGTSGLIARRARNRKAPAKATRRPPQQRCARAPIAFPGSNG